MGLGMYSMPFILPSQSPVDIPSRQTFELLVGHQLFKLDDTSSRSLEVDHLAQMMKLTGETFSSAMLGRAQYRSKYFDEQGWVRSHIHLPSTGVLAPGYLLNIGPVAGKGIEATLVAYGVLPDSSIGVAASFISACLRLDPSERETVEELEHYPWVAHSTCNYH
jgi:serine/threonine-protein kinase SRPK3